MGKRRRQSKIRHCDWRLVKGMTTANQVGIGKVESRLESTKPIKKESLFKRIATYKMSEGEDLRNHLMQFFDSMAQLKSMDIEMDIK